MVYKLFLLKRMRPFLPIQSRILFFKYYIKPYLEYCCSVWGSISQENKHTVVVKLQKRTARLIIDADFQIQSNFLFSELKWIVFPEIPKYNLLSLVFRCINNIVAIYLHNMFSSKSNNHTYLLRFSGSGQLDVPRQHTRII